VNRTQAGRWHLVTAAVAVFAIALQLVLVINGEPILEDTEVPALGIRLGRFFSYFTIQSNLRLRRCSWPGTRPATVRGGGSCVWPGSAASP
jgi:hypothetical protein